MGNVEQFQSRTTPAELEDLRARLRVTRFPDAPAGSGWSLGTDVDYLRELVAYWADGFDWPVREAELNALPRFRVTVRGLGIHLVQAHAAGTGPALPLILTTAGPTRSGDTPR